MASRFDELKDLNIHLKFYHIEDEAFRPFGKVLKGYDVSSLMNYSKENTKIPEEGNVYIASVLEMESNPVKKDFQNDIYGEFPVQIGYCNGRNSNLNGLEFHKGSEINVAVTDMVLLLGSVQDIAEDKTYESNNVRAFYLPEGTVIEMYGTTLHLAPCKTSDNGFKCIVVLPQGTNTELEEGSPKDPLLLMKNKWMLAHPDNKRMIDRGAHPGIRGENVEIYYR